MTEDVPQLLPHEVTLLTNKFDDYVKDQNALGEELGDAMSQAAETFHDNAPADAINHESRLLFARAEPVRELLRKHLVVEYPTEDVDEIVIGSTVIVEIGDIVETYEIAGQRHATQESDEVSIITPSSPLASHLLGKKNGDNFPAVIGNRNTHIRILEVSQTRQRDKYIDLI